MSKTTGLASISEGRSDIHRINPKLIQIKTGWNSRDFKAIENVEHVQMLANSIAEVGVKEPLTVNWENGAAFLEDGECRLRACIYAIDVLKADIKTVPCKVGERYANDAERLFSQQLRNAGKPFTALEQATLFKRLLDLGWQQGDIAKKAGISPARVSQILDFNTMPQGVKTMVHNGEVSPSTAMAVVKEQGTEAEAALKAGLTVAKASGGTKVMAKHVDGEPKVNKMAAIKDAFDYSSVDDEDDGMCLIRMPVEHWEIIRKLLKL